ncbi:hypothetical protein PPYR_02559 [Photinus pyralis]|uniref:Peptidase S1 domain-containing protein n=1 Tax=Photinus pyralis TaxID=7054 RepID=A0A5N4B7K8_PHOPY|nr:granzyme K-like [Photinus pyralis]KAB0805589.1 hypothetical protein PPYR_02559 [Photinus pyralis]
MMAIYQRVKEVEIMVCGGTLIKPKWVLTSNTCYKKLSVYANGSWPFMVARVHNLAAVSVSPKREINMVISHSEYKDVNYTVANDIALMATDTEFLVNSYIFPITLASTHLISDSNCSFVYWNVSMPYRFNREAAPLVKVRVLVKDINNCKQWFNYTLVYSYGQICAQLSHGVIPKQHSGGPLVCNNTQVGLFSSQQESNGETFLIFTELQPYRKFISDVIPALRLSEMEEGATKRKFSVMFNPANSCWALHETILLTLVISLSNNLQHA